jgi:hypothetical protein
MGQGRTLGDGRELLPEWEGLMRYAFAAPRCISGMRLAWRPIRGGLGLFQIVDPAKSTRRARRRARGKRVLLSKALHSGSDWSQQARVAAEASDMGAVRVRW